MKKEKNVYVIVRKGNDWIVGVCDSEYKTFKPLKKVKRLKDVKDVTKCVPLKKYFDDDQVEEIMKSLGVKSFYVMDKPMYLPNDDVEEEWWSDINKDCKKCNKDCKQSSKVKVVKCER